MKKRNVILLVLLLVVGFAAVSTTLVLNGTIGIGSNTNDFDVIFTEALVDGDRAKSLISEDKKAITFASNKITEVGETSVLEYKVKNNSTQYGADVTISCNTTGNEYVSITGEFDGKDIPLTNPITMEAQEVKNGSITAKLIKAYSDADTSISVECKIVASASEKDEVTDYTQDVYKEDILNGTDPVLVSTKNQSARIVIEGNLSKSKDLIPVTLANDGTVTYADITEKWYSYENKEWANAVILKDNYDKLNTQGKIHGATKNSGYVSLDGVDDYIDLGLAKQDFSSGITLATKVSLASIPTEAPAYILANIEGAGFAIYIANDNTFRVQAYIDGQYKYVTLKENIEVGKEYLIVATYDNSELKLYINGKFMKSTSASGNVKTSTMPFTIGAQPNDNGLTGYAPINVYQSAIYDRALTEEEIRNNFSNTIKIKNTEGLLDYQNFTNKRSVGETILEEDIESYFVWIPKYRYKLFDMGEYDSAIEGQPEKSNAKTIEIEFNAKDTTDRESVSCKTPMESGESGNCEVGEWMTHPAFITMNTTGLWVGKFETGYNGATTAEEAQINAVDESKVIIKPNVYSWRNSTIGNMFKTSYNYNRALDSHMMKNTEWGAVVYLSHSKYGINKEMSVNNNSDYLTGYSTAATIDQSSYPGEYGTDATKTLPYNTETGYKASTTGNITGIYDMSGGVHEYMASYVDGYGVQNNAGTASGFNEEEILEYSKYLDKYQNESSLSSWNKRILGDATGEIGPFYNYADDDGSKRAHNSWYRDDSGFVDSSGSWFLRGSRYNDGVLAGQFTFSRYAGVAHAAISSRLVLAP